MNILAIGLSWLLLAVGPRLPAASAATPAWQVVRSEAFPDDARSDDLTALFRFMNDSLGEETPAKVVSFALDAARRQTGADLAGFLSLDVDKPELRLNRLKLLNQIRATMDSVADFSKVEG